MNLDSLSLARAFGGLTTNPFTGLGTARDKAQYTEISPNVRSLSRLELSSLYRKSGVIQRAVNSYPKDAKQAWCRLNFGEVRQNRGISNETVMKYASSLNLRQAIAEASLYGRWFGDGYLVLGVSDGRSPAQEIDRAKIKTIRWIKVFSRWEVSPRLHEGGDRYKDIKEYEIVGYDVPEEARYWHKDRIIRFSGVLLDPDTLSSTGGNNDSIIQCMYESFCAYYPGMQALSILVQDHRLRTLGISGLAGLKDKQQVLERAATNDLLRSVARLEVFDKENEIINNLNNNYAGLDKAIEVLQEAWASDTDMSRVVLFNQLGKSSLTSGEAFKFARLDHAYRLNSWQENTQREQLEYLFEIIMRAADSPTKGKIPKHWSVEFPLLYKMTPEEELNIQKLAAERDRLYTQIGAYDSFDVRKQFETADFDYHLVLEPKEREELVEPLDEEEIVDEEVAPTGNLDASISTDSLWGVWFGGRRTSIVVEATSRSQAIAKARKRKRRGGDDVDSCRRLNNKELKAISGGKWLRTGPKGESAGYDKSKKGYGPTPKKNRSDAGCPPERILRGAGGKFAGCAPSGTSSRRRLPKGGLGFSSARAKKQLFQEESIRDRATKTNIRFYGRPVLTQQKKAAIREAIKTGAAKNKARRSPPKAENLQVETGADGTDRIRIWKGSGAEHARFARSYKYSRNKEFEYSVEHNGKKITLNNHRGKVELQGETIEGMPDSRKRFKTIKEPQSLFDRLARSMGYVESKASPRVPDWQPRNHGGIDKSLVRSRRGAGDYNGMQIHHVHQWSKERFDKINKQVETGQISKKEAMQKMDKLLVPDPSNKKTGYAINISQKRDRKLVILAGGTHDINSPLFSANHPKGYHPKTGEKQQFGIPKGGDGGRAWFDKFRGDFWREQYRRESYQLQAEINQRIKRGEITKEQAASMWQTAHGKAKRESEYAYNKPDVTPD